MTTNAAGASPAEIETPEAVSLKVGPRYTAPVMDTCAHVRSSSPTSGGGFVERELAVARNLAACRDDDARLDEADLSAADPDVQTGHF